MGGAILLLKYILLNKKLDTQLEVRFFPNPENSIMEGLPIQRQNLDKTGKIPFRSDKFPMKPIHTTLFSKS